MQYEDSDLAYCDCTQGQTIIEELAGIDRSNYEDLSMAGSGDRPGLERTKPITSQGQLRFC